MFDVQAVTFGNYTAYRLINQQSGEYVTVVPEVGANVTEMVLKSKDVLHHIIDGYKSAEALKEHKGYRSSRLIPFPNRISDGRYQYENANHQLHINRPKEGHAIHGLFYDRPFVVTRYESGAREAELAMAVDYQGERAGYPFPFKLELVFKLDEGGFRSIIEVVNTGKKKLLFGDGWHPYFKLNGMADDLLLKIPEAELVEVDERNLPTGKFSPYSSFVAPERIGDTKLDIGLRLKGKGNLITELKNPKTDATLCLWQETGPASYNFLQVYIPASRDAVAIEPMTCAANAFNNGFGLIELDPGERFTAEFGVYLK